MLGMRCVGRDDRVSLTVRDRGPPLSQESTRLTAVSHAAIRRPAAILLVLEAALVVQPVLAVSNFFVGAAVVGKALAFVRVPDVVLQGFGFLFPPLAVLLLLLAAWAWHTTPAGSQR